LHDTYITQIQKSFSVVTFRPARHILVFLFFAYAAFAVQIWWTGAKYAYDSKTDITVAFYEQVQNDFRRPSTCSTAAGFRSSCFGTLNEGSTYVDRHEFTG
jgi:hypothetical protein